MPGMYLDGEYDLAGSIVGVVEKSKILTGARVRKGDVLLAMASTGLHTNGYSLARKLLFDVAGLRPDSHVPELASILADNLLQVHRSYLKPLQSLVKADADFRNRSHHRRRRYRITCRASCQKALAAVIDTGSSQIPPLFEMLRSIGNVPEDDWRRTFNLGVGMIFVVPANKAQKALRALKNEAWVIGEIAAQRRGKKPRGVSLVYAAPWYSDFPAAWLRFTKAIANGHCPACKLDAEIAILRASATARQPEGLKSPASAAFRCGSSNRVAWSAKLMTSWSSTN